MKQCTTSNRLCQSCLGSRQGCGCLRAGRLPAGRAVQVQYRVDQSGLTNEGEISQIWPSVWTETKARHDVSQADLFSRTKSSSQPPNSSTSGCSEPTAMASYVRIWRSKQMIPSERRLGFPWAQIAASFWTLITSLVAIRLLTCCGEQQPCCSCPAFAGYLCFTGLLFQVLPRANRHSFRLAQVAISQPCSVSLQIRAAW